eukprot:scaffold27997_cov65-Phaeocystis_antarctica.AAC.8
MSSVCAFARSSTHPPRWRCRRWTGLWNAWRACSGRGIDNASKVARVRAKVMVLASVACLSTSLRLGALDRAESTCLSRRRAPCWRSLTNRLHVGGSFISSGDDCARRDCGL